MVPGAMEYARAVLVEARGEVAGLLDRIDKALAAAGWIPDADGEGNEEAEGKG